MNNDRIEGAWKNFKGKIKEQWGELTNDEVDEAEGQWEQLSGKIQNRYGRAKDHADEEVRKFREQYDDEYERAVTTDAAPLRN